MEEISELDYEKEKSWGLLTSIDLYDCESSIIKDKNKIEEYVVELCKLINVKPFGKCVVVNFGERPEIAGYSMTQLIETSLISGHFANKTNSTYLDIFSCKYYSAKKASDFSKKFFKAKSMKLNCLLRK